MCDPAGETMNLIDFIEDTPPPGHDENGNQPVAITTTAAVPKPTTTATNALCCLLDNNPFDQLHTLANHPQDDPFEMVEREASRNATQKHSVQVKMAKLLSLSDDNILDEEVLQPDGSTVSSVYHTAVSIDLDGESPPLTMSANWTPTTATDSGSSNDANSAKSRKAVEFRKHLLKLSISNSTFNSPVSRRMQLQQFHGEGGCSEEDDHTESPLSTVYSKAARSCEHTHLLAEESPVKLIEDSEDAMRESLDAPAAAKVMSTEKDFDEDLKLLTIPMLERLPSPKPREPTTELLIQSQPPLPTAESTLPDLAAIQQRLRMKREKAQALKDSHDINELLANLKTLICDTEIVNDTKRGQAKALLETLGIAMNQTEGEGAPIEAPDAAAVEVAPKPIVRQGTFDIDLQDKEEEAGTAEPTELTQSVMTQSTASATSVQSHAEPFPDCMVSSSATYDGEPLDEKHLQRLKALASPPPHPPPSAQTDLNDIITQLGKLLEQQTPTETNGGNGDQSMLGGTGYNPTFIVVMNTSQVPGATLLHDPQNTSILGNAEGFDDATSADWLNSSSRMQRRRSQSLSIHDKLRIVQLPIKGGGEPPVAPPMDLGEPRTPSRAVARRNSFSHATPYTAKRTSLNPGVIGRRMGFESVTETSPLHRRPSAPTRPPQKLPQSFKPDVKKKLRSASNADSVMKSSGPLKATIPFKKVVPTKDDGANFSGQPQLSQLPFSATPMPAARLGVDGGMPFPSACSTPAVHIALKRTDATTPKPRFSYLAGGSSPRPKIAQSTTAAAGALKRRTLNDLKSKSPAKPYGGSTTVSSIGSRKSLAARATEKPSAGARIWNRPATASTLTRPATRMAGRSSFGGVGATNRNKENKQP